MAFTASLLMNSADRKSAATMMQRVKREIDGAAGGGAPYYVAAFNRAIASLNHATGDRVFFRDADAFFAFVRVIEYAETPVARRLRATPFLDRVRAVCVATLTVADRAQIEMLLNVAHDQNLDEGGVGAEEMNATIEGLLDNLDQPSFAFDEFAALVTTVETYGLPCARQFDVHHTF